MCLGMPESSIQEIKPMLVHPLICQYFSDHASHVSLQHLHHRLLRRPEPPSIEVVITITRFRSGSTRSTNWILIFVVPISL